MFFDSEVEIYYDLLKNDQILLQWSFISMHYNQYLNIYQGFYNWAALPRSNTNNLKQIFPEKE
jgi:hypothetical protein